MPTNLCKFPTQLRRIRQEQSNIPYRTKVSYQCKLYYTYLHHLQTMRGIYVWKPTSIHMKSVNLLSIPGTMLFQIWFFYPQVSFKRVISFPGVVRSNSIILIAIVRDILNHESVARFNFCGNNSHGI